MTGLVLRSSDELALTWLTLAQLEAEFPDIDHGHVAPAVVVTLVTPDADPRRLAEIAHRAKELGLDPICGKQVKE